MRVAVLPTGGMELVGVPPALKALFPAHEFDSIPKRPDDQAPFDSFTSSDKPLTPHQPNGNVDKIVERMAAELVPGRCGRAPDLLVVLEDLEVPNKHQPAVVVQVFRDATTRHVEKLRQDKPRLAGEVEKALRSKASFHLAVPMIEAWLFADPNGPGNAAAPPARWPTNRERTRDRKTSSRKIRPISPTTVVAARHGTRCRPRERKTTTPRGGGSNASFTRRPSSPAVPRPECEKVQPIPRNA